MSDRIEPLLDELRAIAGPPAWQRIEELVRELLALNRACLERVLACAADDREMRARLSEDELVSSLLLLHGLHPRSPRERIQTAIDHMRSRFGANGPAVNILDVGSDSVSLRMDGAPTCSSSRETVERAFAQAIELAAPEIIRIEFARAVEETPLVQIAPHRLRRSPAGSAP